ncbi:Hypothetical predicted protein [Pelobates cultripes]|uniref:Uncharacterized protein n=1 Tax=Pelobates cultripes TaxID=61616 RepID=A0AAD1WKZ2_PELCU|nr:Hypothetical predicted protein [Pelobates cultripes]
MLGAQFCVSRERQGPPSKPLAVPHKSSPVAHLQQRPGCKYRGGQCEVTLPIGILSVQAVGPGGGASAVRPKSFKGAVRAIVSPDENVMEIGAEVLQIKTFSALPQRIHHDATTKMAASPDVFSTPKMAAATSNMATTTFKAATYNPNMPPELADLPPSAGMIIQLIKDLRVDLKNDFKKDFDALYGAMEGINQRTEIIENKLHSQE